MAFRSSPYRQTGDVTVTGSQTVSGKIVVSSDGDPNTTDAIFIESEVTTPAAPQDGKGGILYVKSDGKLYWRSYELGETDLTSGSGGGLSFGTFRVAGQDDVVADSGNDTLTFAAGSGMTITTNSGSDTITFASTGGGGSGTPGGSDTQIQFNDGGSFGGSPNLVWDGTSLSITGDLTASVNISASAFYGDGTGLTGVQGLPGGSDTSIQFNNNGTLDGSNNLIWDGSSLSITGDLTSSANISGSSFYGDGSNITNLTASNIDNFQTDVRGQISAGTGINFSSGEVSLANTSVTAGTYGDESNSAQITVDAQGRITNVSEISISGGGGGGGGSSTIGAAEDGTYGDGLFTDFTSTTSIGTAVDRFNEVLKILAPSPAPDLSSISENVTDGITAKLSFGSSQAIADYSSSSTTAGFTAVDINESYSASTSGDNIRLGIYDGTQDISGIINAHISASITNGYYAYASGAFGNAETGTLKLELNGVVVHSVDLSVALGTGSAGSGTGESLTNDSGFTHFSTKASSFDGNGAEWDIFKHRTSRYKLDANSMNKGWNYLRVIHTIGSTDKTTNYIEWINDPSGSVNNLAASNERIEDITLVGSKYLSGVEYNTDATANYKVDLSNMYQNVYQTSGTPITFSVTNSSTPSAQSVPAISVGSEDATKVLGLTASLDVNTNVLLSGAITANFSATHPLKNSISSAGSATTGNGFLIDNRTQASSNTVEYFHDETYRKTSGSYSLQSDVTNASSLWDSTNHMTSSGASGHEDGLIFYNQRLYSPVDADIPVLGNFSAMSNVESGQPDYSGITGTRTFYRVLSNSSGVDKRDIKITTYKSSTTFNNSTLGSSNAHLYIKVPGTTGWMDASQTFSYGDISEGAGALIAGASANDTDSGNNVHCLTFGTASVANGDHVMIKIEADESWAGYISQMNFQLGASTANATEAPTLDDIDANDSGNGSTKLSFGSSNAITSYSPATGSSISLSDYDTNSNFPLSGDRRGVFNSFPTIDGELNEDVGSNTSYSANAFKDAMTGSLVLEVNGAEVHSIDLSSTMNAISNDYNSNGSGFSVSSVSFSDTSDNIPDYRKPYRTGNYVVVPSEQNLGWNYARVIHRLPSGDVTTNYVEWIVDTNSDSMTSGSVALSNFNHDNKFYQSGVGYFASRPSASYTYDLSNVYKNVYQNGTAITYPTTTRCSITNIRMAGSGVTTTNTAASSTSLAALNNTANCQEQVLQVTGTVLYDNIESIVEENGFYSDYGVTVSSRVIHPFKSTINTNSLSKDKFMFYSGSLGSTNLYTNEYFNLEQYRIISASYSAQSDITNSSNEWDSSNSMNDSVNYAAYADGLAFLKGYLVSPVTLGSSGDTRNVDDGGSLQAPSGNPDYRSSSLTVSERTFYRYFENNTVNDRTSITITIYGSGSIVPRSTSLGANGNFYVDVKIPGKTAWLDLGKALNSGEANVDGAGCRVGDLPASISSGGSSLGCSFKGQALLGTISGAEKVLIRISADKEWLGHLTRLQVAYS